MDDKFLKPYDPQATEPRIYQEWEESGYFNPDRMLEDGLTKPDAKAYSIVLPPPNVTGRLHMGHALMLAVEDVFVRTKRMQGYRTLWIPGTDHAAIATQSVVEKEISKKEGKSRHDLGREELLARIGAFANESHDTIVSQLKVMGASLDWSREAFTLDETRTRAVHTVFKQMYDAGLIYRGNRIVNWDPKGQTTISDDEIVHEERKAKLYTFKYSKDFPISISTTRPETKVGDVAVAVHPDDTRYKEFVGKTFDAVFCEVPISIRVVADKEVDPEFGTGALGVTPAHSQIDWDIADRHDLPRTQVINEYAKMMVEGRLNGKKTTEARDMVVEWLREEGLLEKEEDISQNISLAERTSGVIEPLPKLQWFIDVNKEIPGRGKSLKELMLDPVRDGRIEILPEHFDKTYFHWIENLRDWCISRQIWYGHRVPVWYRGDEIVVGEAPDDDGWSQ
ncbi:MAG: class I tRNA ligase family protein, partial [bacterium]|nr:class I tRNA ligase family protein [bacterium]